MHHISIPKCLTLDPRVETAINEWAGTFKKLDYYEDCCCSSPFTFSVYASGIGDVLSVQREGRILAVGINDDNELYSVERESD